MLKKYSLELSSIIKYSASFPFLVIVLIQSLALLLAMCSTRKRPLTRMLIKYTLKLISDQIK